MKSPPGSSQDIEARRRQRQSHHDTLQRAGYRPTEWAKAAGVSRGLVYKLLAANKLHSVKLGATRVITTSPSEYLASLADDEAAA